MPTLKIKNPTIVNPNQQNNPAYIVSTAILFGTSVVEESLGNVEIINPTIIDTRTPKQIKRAIHLENNSYSKVKVIDPIRLDAAEASITMFAPDSVIKDSNKLLVTDTSYSGGIDVGDYDCRSLYRNTASVDFVPFNLLQRKSTSPVTFEVTGAYKMVIKPPTGKNILPLSTTGQRVESTGKGCKITLVPLPDGNWTVDNVVGTWTVST